MPQVSTAVLQLVVELLAEPFDIGTLSRVIDMNQEQGLMNITLVGEQRFRIINLIRKGDRLWADIDTVTSHEEPIPGDLTSAVIEEVNSLRAIAENMGFPTGDGMPEAVDPAVLSYSIASALPVDLGVKQELLEIPEAGERLDQLLHLMRKTRLQILGNTSQDGVTLH